LPFQRGPAELLFVLSIAFAIPLLLFTADVVRWARYAGRAVVAFGIACLSITLVASGLVLAFGHLIPYPHWVAGMLVGSFTGGSVNLNAIGISLQVPPEMLLVVNGAEVAGSACFIVFVVFLSKPLLGRLLPAYRGPVERPEAQRAAAKVTLPGVGWALLMALGVVLVGLGLLVGVENLMLPADLDLLPEAEQEARRQLAQQQGVTALMLGVTTLSVLLSFVPRLRRLEASTSTGEYILLIFSVNFGLLLDFSQFTADLGLLFVFAFGTLLLALTLHYTLCGLLEIDVDTAIITSVAAVLSVPFIVPMAEKIGNRGVILSGLATAIIGYMVGTYLGLALSWVLGPG
jgi:uncharacterized membrane protein